MAIEIVDTIGFASVRSEDELLDRLDNDEIYPRMILMKKPGTYVHLMQKSTDKIFAK